MACDPQKHIFKVFASNDKIFKDMFLLHKAQNNKKARGTFKIICTPTIPKLAVL